MKCELTISYSTTEKRNCNWYEFEGENEEGLLKKALEIAKKRVKKFEKEYSLFVMLWTGENKKDDLWRIRKKYRNKRLLRIKNPFVCFVRGYGTKTAEELKH